MPIGQFLTFSAIGTFVWTAALAMAGYLLGQAYETVADYVDPVSTAVLVGLVAVYGYRVATFKRESD